MEAIASVLGYSFKRRTLIADVHIEVGTLSESEILTVTLDMGYMGIRRETEFDFELSKDISREVASFAGEYGRIPTAEELKERVEKYQYGHVY
jgi:hypothetical protein